MPLITLIMLGTVDFGRLFFAGVVAANAAGVGAFVGAQNGISAGDYAAMETSALSDAAERAALTATADQQCRCPDGTVVGCTEIEETTCNGYGVPRAYVRVRTADTFETFGAYPWIPSHTNIGRQTWMRVR